MYQELNQLILMLLPLLFSVACHEAAHGFAAFRMGDPTAYLAGRVTLNPLRHLDPFGSVVLPLLLILGGSPFVLGYARPVPVDLRRLGHSPRGQLLVASAGVAANLLLMGTAGLLFQGAAALAAGPEIPVFFRPFLADLLVMLGYGVIINAILAIFNLIPIPPLDGSRILRVFLPLGWQRSFLQLESMGMILMVILLVSGVLEEVLSFFVEPLILLSLGGEGLRLLMGK